MRRCLASKTRKVILSLSIKNLKFLNLINTDERDWNLSGYIDEAHAHRYYLRVHLKRCKNPTIWILFQINYEVNCPKNTSYLLLRNILVFYGWASLNTIISFYRRGAHSDEHLKKMRNFNISDKVTKRFGIWLWTIISNWIFISHFNERVGLRLKSVISFYRKVRIQNAHLKKMRNINVSDNATKVFGI